MPHSLLPALLLQIFVLGYTPGPANIFALTTAIRYGRRKALRMWTGLFTGATAAVLCVAVATHFLGEALGDYVIYLKYLGALYLLYLAYKMWRDSGQPKDDARGCSFKDGCIVQLTNAKIILFEMSVFSSFVIPYSHRFTDLLPVAALLLLAGPGANLVWLMAGSALSKFFAHYHKEVDIFAAIAIAGCAIYIALS